MSLMSKTANFAVVVRPQKLEGSKLGDVAKSLMQRANIKQLTSACAIDPMKDISLLIVSGDIASNYSTVFAQGSFDMKRVDDCVGKLESAVPGVTVARTGDMIEVAMQGQRVYARWVSGGLLISPIKARVDMTKLEGPSAELQAGFAHFAADALVSFTAVSLANSGVGPMGIFPDDAKPNTARGNLSLQGGLKLDVRAGLADATSAKKALAKLNELMEMGKKAPMAGTLLRHVKLGTAGSDVTIDVALSDDQLSMILNMAKMFM